MAGEEHELVTHVHAVELLVVVVISPIGQGRALAAEDEAVQIGRAHV